jgi:alkanesulfonate monooxygenase SsuD/methylene tetrahydromethanopterin reductase-like flavin-dependent oxidoreductase (luciferase family)
MELGFFTMPLHPPGSDFSQTVEADIDQLVTLDGLGYKEAWIGEHFTAEWENIPAPDLVIAAALPVTRQIKFGIGVSCMPNHNPFLIAHRIAQLDHMAKGRFYWGVGSGGFPGDFTVFGFDPKTGDHRTMSREAIELVLEIWRDPKPGRYKNRFWDFTIPEPEDDIGLGLHMRPYQLPHPPIGVAGVSLSSDTLILAGERDWIPMSINIVPSRILKSHWESVEQGAANVGRSPDRSKWRVARDVYVADSTDRARSEVLDGTLARDFRGYFRKLLYKNHMLDLTKTDPDMPDSAITAEYCLDNLWIVGDPDEVVAKIRSLYEELGGFGTLLAMGHEWQPRDRWTHSMTLLAEEVMPRLSDLN